MPTFFGRKPGQTPPEPPQVGPLILPRKLPGKGQVVGYARVSTADQNLDIQIEQLKQAGCERIFHEKLSALARERPELDKALEYVRDGDLLVVTRIDRLARNTRDLWQIIAKLQDKGVGFSAILQPEIDTTSTMFPVVLTIMGYVAEMERNLIKSRQREGIEAAKAKGVYTRKDSELRKQRIEQATEMRAAGVWPSSAAKELGLKQVSTLYKYSPGSWLNDPAWQQAARERYGEDAYSAYREEALRRRGALESTNERRKRKTNGGAGAR